MFKKDSQFSRAAQFYEESADMYEMDGKSVSSARKCKEELAMILAEEEGTMGSRSPSGKLRNHPHKCCLCCS